MATEASSNRPTKRRGILFKLSMVLLVLVVLLIAAFFVVTSSAFFKGVILPKVGASLNSDITVSDASIGLSEVVLNDLKLVPHGRDPLLQAQLVRTRFSLRDIIGGNIVVHEVTLQSPVITVVKNADGTSNLDPLTQQKKTTTTEEKKPSTTETKAQKEQKIDITNVAIKNAQVTMTEKLKGGGQKVTQISNFDFAVDHLQNGAPGKLQISGNARVDQPAVTGAEAGTMEAKLGVNFDYKLASDLSPQSVSGTAQAEITSATGSMAELATTGVNLNCNLTPTEIQNLALQLQRGGNTLGELRVNGPFSAEKKEGKFNVSLIGLDHQALNLVGATYGIDFNQTHISLTNQIELQQGGNTIAVTGNFDASQFSITKKADSQTTPPLDLHIAYQVTVDQSKQSALLQKLQINGVQNQNDILTGTLSKPMPVSWGQGAGVPEEAAFDLKVNNLNLADWKSLAGDVAPSGSATLSLNLISKNAGKQLTVDLNSHLANLSAKLGSNQIANADIQLTTKAQVEEFKKVTLSEYQLKLAEQDQPVVTVVGSGTVDTASKAADLKTTLEANLPQLLHLVSVPGVTVSSGDVKFDGHIVQAGNTQSLDAQISVANLSAKSGSNQISNADIQITTKGQVIDSKKINLTDYKVQLAQRGQTAVTIAGSGTVDTSTKSTDVKTTLQASLPQLLQIVSIPNLSVSSGDVNFDGHVVQAGNSQAVNGKLSLINLSGDFNKTDLDRLAAQINADIALTGADLNIKQLNGSVTQADQPAGNFDVSGIWNLSNNVGKISAKLAGFNQHALGPFLAPSLGNKQLVSVQIDGSAGADLQAAGTGSFNADLTVTNLVVKDPAHPSTNASLYAHFVVDGSMKPNVLDLKNARIALSPTERAKNELQLNGQVDLSKSNNIVANLTAHSDAIDVTQWYDLYAKPQSTTQPQKQVPATESTSPAVNTANANAEPAAVSLPIQKATVDVSIDHLYLHDLDITEKCTVNVSDHNHVNINPLEITINKAPIKANVDLDLSVPGYKYNLTFSADKVPVGALADTFMPESKGAYKGDLIAKANFKGQGTTGKNLHANLNGQANLILTNADVQLTLSKRWKSILSTVALVLQTPEITQSPLTLMTANLSAGNGQLQIENVVVQGAAYQATTEGTIPIADVLTNSPLNMPVQLNLANNLAQRSRLASTTSGTSAYSPLPQFLTIVGTVGQPKEKINKVALAATTAQTIGNIIGGKNGQTVSALGGLLGGSKSQPATGATTNTAPPSKSNANKSSINDLLNGVGGFFKKK